MKHVLILLALLAVPLAAAQSESDYDASAPADDTSYLADDATPTDSSNASDTLAETDLNTSAPADDTSYLSDDATPPAASDSGSGDFGAGAAPPAAPPSPTAKAPGFELPLAVAAIALVVIARRR